MRLNFTWLLFILFTSTLIAQDGINQVIVVNGGQFGNASEQANVAAFDPVAQTYTVIDTIPVNSVQDIFVEGDYAYVAAQDFIVKYDLDARERVGIANFPGISAHKLAIYEDKLLATNWFAQTANNLYIFDKNTMTLLDSVPEIISPGGGMVVVGDKLYVGQNMQASVDNCDPFGCFDDTLGYLAEVDLITNQWVQNIPLNNNGNEIGVLFTDGSIVYAINHISNTITAYNPVDGSNVTVSAGADVTTDRYRTEGLLYAGSIISKFNNGIGSYNTSTDTFTMLVDTPITSFTYDFIDDVYYITSTDFFSYNDGYAFDGNGNHLYDFQVGFAPEAIGIQYNTAPIGGSYEAQTADTIVIDVNEVASDPDGDSILAVSVVMAPANGVVTILADGSIMYRSLSPGSADVFKVSVCDDKLNSLCAVIEVTITGVSPVNDLLYKWVVVYPNPVKSELYIKNQVEGSTYQVYNALGKLVIDAVNIDLLNVDFLTTGNYFLRMSKDEFRKTFVFIKE